MACEPKNFLRNAGIILCFFMFYLSGVRSSVTPTVPSIARQACQDGTYQHEGKTCCLCGAGLRLQEHCSVRPDDRVCVPCKEGTYSSHANSQKSCEPCRSCSHANANLEEAEACTRGKDAVCRCKEHHYCGSDKETCTFCLPCKECGAEGIQVACTAKTNTVCNDPNQGADHSKIVLGVVLTILFIAAAVSLFFCWKKKWFRKTPDEVPPKPAEERPLRDMDLSCHLPDIAKLVEWKVMRDIAIKSGMSPTTIDAHQHNHPKDTIEQTHCLLREWVDMHGMSSSTKLIQMLEKMGKKDAAEKVIALIETNEHPVENSVSLHESV